MKGKKGKKEIDDKNGDVDKKIIDSFQKSLFGQLTNVGISLAEVGLDSIVSTSIITNIPVLSVLYALGKTARDISRRNMMKNTLVFCQEFQKSEFTEKTRRYIDEIKKDPKRAEAELGRTLIILDRFVDLNKAKILARIFRAYIEQDIKQYAFFDLCEILDKMLLSDLAAIEYEYFNANIYFKHEIFSYEANISRLVSLGLMTEDTDAYSSGNPMRASTRLYTNYHVSDYGSLLCIYGLKGKDYGETNGKT